MYIFAEDTITIMENSKKCPYCGKEIKESALKCRYCGHWLTDNHEGHVVPCPVCGEEIPDDTKVCPFCHENVEAAVKQLSAVEHKQQREQELEKIRQSIKQKREELKQILDKEQKLEELSKKADTTAGGADGQEKDTPTPPSDKDKKEAIAEHTPSKEESKESLKSPSSQEEEYIPQDTPPSPEKYDNTGEETVKPAVISCFLKQLRHHFCDFSGRLGRKEYWYFLIYALIAMAIVFALFGINHENILHHHRGLLRFAIPAILNIGLLIPLLSATARRLHDTGRSGWFIIANIIPILGTIWLIIMLLEPSYKAGGSLVRKPVRWKLLDSAIVLLCLIVYGYSVAASDMSSARHNPLLGPQAEDSIAADTATTGVEEEEEETVDTTPAPAPQPKKVEEEVDTTPIPAKEAERLEQPEPTTHHGEESGKSEQNETKHHHPADSTHVRK